MKKITGLLAGILAASLLLSGCSGGDSSGGDTAGGGSQSSGDVVQIKIAHNSSETNPIHLGYEAFKKIAEEKSEGRFQVQIFPNAQLGSGDEANADMVKNNVVQMSAVPTYTLAAQANIPEYKLCDIPYLFSSDEEIYKIMEGELGQQLLDKLKDSTGIKGYPPYVQGWIKLTTKNNSISSPEDIKGLKIRTSNSDFYIKMIDSWGANPTPMNYGEVFTALQQGTVDGIVTTTALYIPDRLYEVQNYMATVNPLAIVHVPIVNNSFYEGLPDDLKTIFDEAMDGYVEAVRQYHVDAEENAIGELRELGMEVTELTDEQFNAFKDLTMPYVDAMAEDIGKDFYDQVVAELG